MKISEGCQSNVVDEFQQVHTIAELNPMNPNILAEDHFSINLYEEKVAPVLTNRLNNNEELEINNQTKLFHLSQ